MRQADESFNNRVSGAGGREGAPIGGLPAQVGAHEEIVGGVRPKAGKRGAGDRVAYGG